MGSIVSLLNTGIALILNTLGKGMNFLIQLVMSSTVSLFSSKKISLLSNTLGKGMNPIVLTVVGSIIRLLYF